MLNAENIIKQMEAMYYWDSRITGIFCSNLFDEVQVGHDENTVYKFVSCYDVHFEHDLKYTKESFLDYKNLPYAKMPYFIHSIDISVVQIESSEFYKTVIAAWPLTLTIISRDVLVCPYSDSKYNFVKPEESCS